MVNDIFNFKALIFFIFGSFYYSMRNLKSCFLLPNLLRLLKSETLFCFYFMNSSKTSLILPTEQISLNTSVSRQSHFRRSLGSIFPQPSHTSSEKLCICPSHLWKYLSYIFKQLFTFHRDSYWTKTRRLLL